MDEIKNINLEFNCPENRDTFQQSGNGYHCDKCSKQVIDFTKSSNSELQSIISRSTEPICGIFKRSQLSQKFVKYAAATVIATASSLTAQSQDVSLNDSTLQSCDHQDASLHEDEFFGTISETMAAPIGGMPKFYQALSKMLKIPQNLQEKGRVYIQFTVDTLGQMQDFKVIKGYHPLADQAALEAFSMMNFPFTPGKQKGKPIKTRLVFPVIFDPQQD